ncbi:nfx1-type zinc finger-containing protein 1 [Moniliophthora roreri]|nr:nfx1-type zinc finger-containing protein 1 [Moniliophthora roreri]
MSPHKLFDDICHGRTKLDHDNTLSFLESLCSHPNPVPILLESSSGLIFSQLDKCLEDDVRRVLAALAETPLFYVSLFTSITEDYLTEETKKWFAWLILQHVSQPESLSSRWSPLLKVYKDTPAVEVLLRSPQQDVREVAEKIVVVAPKRNEEEDGERTGPGGRHDNDFEDFRAISIFPTPAEIMSKAKSHLIPSSAFEKEEEDPIKRREIYLETQFRLSREEMVVELREDARDLIEGEAKNGMESIIPNIELVGIETDGTSLAGYWSWKFKCPADFDLSFGRLTYTPPIPKLPGWKDWDLVLLMEGNEILAVCNFGRDDNALEQTPPVFMLRPYGNEAVVSNALLRLKNTEPKRVLKLNGNYWDRIGLLKRIQTMTSLPFIEILSRTTIRREVEHLPSDVLRAFEVNEKCDIGQLLRFTGGRRNLVLSEDQASALSAALRERVCLVQGMPGTGKTLLAALLAGILFQHTSHTIMVCCSTESGLNSLLQEVFQMISALHVITLLERPSLQLPPITNPGLRLDYQPVPQNPIDSSMKAILDALSADLTATFTRITDSRPAREDIIRYLAANHPDYHTAFSAPDGTNGSSSLLHRWIDGQDAPDAEDAQLLWSIPASERQTLLRQWTTSILEEAASQFAHAGRQINVTLDIARRSGNLEFAKILRSKRLIGTTYHGVQANLHTLRDAGFPDVVIFDDADYGSEDFMLAAMGPETKHLIMIGSAPVRTRVVEDWKLCAGAKEGYELDVSLFERLMRNGYPYHSLYTQHSSPANSAPGLVAVGPPTPAPANTFGGWGTAWSSISPVPPHKITPVNQRITDDSDSSRSPSRSQSPSPLTLPLSLTSRKVGAAEKEWNRRKSELGAHNVHVDAIMDMIGIEDVKQQILDILDNLETMKRQKRSMEGLTFNAAMFGNPGLGISTFAGHYTRFLKSIDMLTEEKYHEITTADADHFQQQVSQIKFGGAIHVVDAHSPGKYGYTSWLNSSNSVGSVTASALVEMMRAGAGKQAFIFSGPDTALWGFLDANAVLRDSLPQKFFFTDYTEEHLTTILEERLRETFKEVEMVVEGGIEGHYVQPALKRFLARHSYGSFANARSLDVFLEDVLRRQTKRLTKEQKDGSNPNYNLITKEDLLSIADSTELEDALKELDSLVGLEVVKQTVRNLVKIAQVNEQRELQGKKPLEVLLNRIFLGPPGTGKTTVAKVYAKILKQLGYLSYGEVITKHATDFIGRFIGQSEAITKEIVASAAGSVLIIDEAHVLNPKNDNSADCFKEAVIDTLISCVQNTPGEDRCIILVGYEDEMLDMFQNANPGLARRFRINDAFRFEDFTQDELMQIFESKLSEDHSSAIPAAKAVVADMLECARHRPNFGNGGEVQNLIATATENYYGRFEQGHFPEEIIFEPQDFDPDFGRSAEAPQRLADLFSDMVGCEEIVSKLSDYQKISHTMRLCGKDARKVIPMNFVFKGPPGTGKTTVARKMGHVFYDMGLLSSPEVIECSASDMVGKYLGHTGPKTRELFTRALGKVLFIDEAYRLGHGEYSGEAIGELVTLLTLKTYQGKMVVILAGYDYEMDRLLSSNRGLSSRFPEEIIFKDTDADSCLTILRLELARHGVTLPCLSEKKSRGYRSLADVIKSMSGTISWGNARDMISLSVHLVREAHKEPLDPRSKTFEVPQKTALKYLTAMREEQKARASHTTPSWDPQEVTYNQDADFIPCAIDIRGHLFHTTPTPLHSTFRSRISQKIWYRKDGTPRSKIRGLIITLLASGFILVSTAALDVMQDLEDLTFQFASMLQVQRVDFEEFNQVDFEDFKHTATYFSNLCTPFLVTPQYAEEDAVKEFFNNLKDFSFINDAGLKDKLQATMKSAAQDVHELLKDTKERPVESAQEVSRILRDAIVMVILGLEMNADEKLAAVMKAFKDRENDKPPPPKEKGKSYDLIG